MPKLTQYTRQVRPTGGQSIISASPDAFGAMAGRGMESFGKDLQSISATLTARAERRDKLKASEMVSNARLKWMEHAAEKAQTMEEGGAGFADGLRADFDKYAASIDKATLGTTAGREALGAGLNDLRVSLISKAIGMEASASSAFEVQQFRSGTEADVAVLRKSAGQFDEIWKAKETLIDGLVINGNMKAALKRETVEKFAYASIQNLTETNPAEAKRQLEDGKWDAFLKGERVNTLLKGVDKAMQEESRDAMIAQSLEYSNLLIAALDKKLTRAEVDDFRDKMNTEYAQSGTQLVALERALRVQNEDTDLLTAQIQYGTLVFNGTAVGNPEDKDVKKALNVTYDAMLTTLFKGKPNAEEITKFNRTFVDNTGYLPKSLENNLVGQLVSASPETSAHAATEINALITQSPFVRGQFSDETIRRADLVGRYINMGLSDREAALKAEELARVPKATIDAYDTAFEAVNRKPTSRVAAGLADEFDPGIFTIGPDSNVLVEAEYTQLAKEHFRLNGGDMDAAKKSAASVLKKTWGPTEVNGKLTIMKFAPETYYSDPHLSPSENRAWIRRQLIDDAVAGGVVGAGVEDRIRFTVHPTKQHPDGRPAYAAFILGPDGIFRMVTKPSGEPVALAPDFTKTTNYTERQAERQKKIDDARALREGPDEEMMVSP